MSSIDTYHPTAGIKNKLLAYYQFLRDYPSYRHKVVLIQYVTPIICCSGKTDTYHEELLDEIDILRKMRDDICEIVEQIH